MPKLFFENYLSNQGKVEIPDADHVGIELDDGTIIELSSRPGRKGAGHKCRLASHESISIEPTSSNCADIGQAGWSRAIDQQTKRKRPSQVNAPPGHEERGDAYDAMARLDRLINNILGSAAATRTAADRKVMSTDLRDCVNIVRRAL